MRLKTKRWAYVLITFEMAQKYHRLLWRWLARNPDRRKEHWPVWFRFDFAVPNDCFACYIARTLEEDRVFCANCPVTEWRENFNPEPFAMAACQADQYGEYLRLQDHPGTDKFVEQTCLEIAEVEWTRHPDRTYPLCSIKEPR